MGRHEDPLDLLTRALEEAGCRPKAAAGGEFFARCPVRGKRGYDSLSYRVAQDGSKVLLRCHAHKCTAEEICESLNLAVADLFYQEARTPPKKRGLEDLASRIPLRSPEGENGGPGTLEATYSYNDESGEVLYQVLRYRREDGTKTFRQRRPGQNGSWEWRLGDVRRVLYRLPEVLEAVKRGEAVYLVEGEKDADRLVSLGLTATCTLGGALEKPGSWNPEWSRSLLDATVRVLPDNDHPGRVHARIVEEALRPSAKSVRVVDLPGLPPKGDVSDWLNEGHTAEDLKRLAEASRLRVLKMHDFLASEFPEKRALLAPWLRERDLVMVHAWRGVGKTHFSLGVALAVATGGEFLGWQAPAMAGVLYVDGEMTARDLQTRIVDRLLGSGVTDTEKIAAVPLHVVTPDVQEFGIRSIDTAEGQRDLEDLLQKLPEVRLIVLDNLSCLTSSSENESEGWEPMKTLLLRLRVLGYAVVLVHHSGKGGAQRGTSKREDQLDAVVHLSRPRDYVAAEGARFEIRFEKARALHGPEIREIEAWLREDEDGRPAWAIKTIEESTQSQVLALYREGLHQAEIARELNINRSTVSRAVRRAQEKGLINGN